MIHTSSPWTIGNAHDTARDHAITSGAKVVARVTGLGYPIGTGWSPESEANARLIASAPELLEALYSLLNVEGAATLGATLPAWHGMGVKYHFEKARAAIAKATGETK